MRSPAEFRIDVYEKRDARLAARKKVRRRAFAAVPLAAVVLAAGIFAGPRLLSNRRVPGPNVTARTLQVGRPAQVEKVNVWEETEKRMGKDDPDLTEEEQAEFERLYGEIRNANSVDPKFQSALNDFARDATLALAGDFQENDCCCPLSLYYALALAGQGAEGETQREFLDLLGAESLPWLADQCRLFYQNCYTDDEYGILTLANSLWMDGRCNFKDDYLSTAENDMFSSLFQADFTSQTAGDEMARWISENTGGLLQPEFRYGEDYDDLTMLALINTVYLKAQWYDQFLEEFNETGDFTKADGSVMQAEYMCRTDVTGSACLGDGFTRASRGLTAGGEMIFILPDEGVTPQELLSDPEKFEEMFYPKDDETEMTDCELRWRVPKFTIDSEFDLMDSLRKLGLTTALDPNRADFSGMTDDFDLYLAAAQQGVHAAIDEDGVEAAAYTELMVNAGSAMPQEKPPVIEMDLNRPFLFAITADTPTAGGESFGEGSFGSSLLFVGVCGAPSAK